MYVKWLCKCIKWICKFHLETVNLNQEERKDNSSDFMSDSNFFKTAKLFLNPSISEIVFRAT